jgi:hypothetical protein
MCPQSIKHSISPVGLDDMKAIRKSTSGGLLKKTRKKEKYFTAYKC